MGDLGIFPSPTGYREGRTWSCKYEGIWKNMWEIYVENMKRYVGNMWKIYVSEENFELSPSKYIQNRGPHPWFENFRGPSLPPLMTHSGKWLWDLEKLQASPIYRLCDFKNYDPGPPTLHNPKVSEAKNCKPTSPHPPWWRHLSGSCFRSLANPGSRILEPPLYTDSGTWKNYDSWP